MLSAVTTATGLTASKPSDLSLVPVTITSSTLSSAASSCAITSVLKILNVRTRAANR